MKFLATCFFMQSSHILETQDSLLQVSLSRLQSEFITIYPIVEWSRENKDIWELVVLGFEGKMNSAGAVRRIRMETDGKLNLAIHGCGRLIIALRVVSGGLSSVYKQEGIRCTAVVDGDQSVLHAVWPGETDRGEWDEVGIEGSLGKELLTHGFFLLLVDVLGGRDQNSGHEVSVDLASCNTR